MGTRCALQRKTPRVLCPSLQLTSISPLSFEVISRLMQCLSQHSHDLVISQLHLQLQTKLPTYDILGGIFCIQTSGGILQDDHPVHPQVPILLLLPHQQEKSSCFEGFITSHMLWGCHLLEMVRLRRTYSPCLAFSSGPTIHGKTSELSMGFQYSQGKRGDGKRQLQLSFG